MMESKNTLFILSPQRASQSPKYPTLKKSQDTIKDIAFRLNFSPIKNQERNINHVMSTFDKPFATLGMDSEARKKFTQIILDLKTTFEKIDKSQPNPELNKSFWIQWNQFDTILHQISIHSAYYYCSREIERLTLDITGSIKSIRSNPPAVPGIQHEFSLIVDKIQKSFIQIVDRFAEICDSKIDEAQKIRDLESMRNQIRQFRTDILGECKFFTLSSANHSAQDKAKSCIESSLTTIVAAISDLKRQTYLLDNLDSEIANAMRVIEMMIEGEPLPNAKSERISEQNSIKIEKENICDNNDLSFANPKGRLPRRCTINSFNKENGVTRRNSRRRQSIKRNSLIINLDKSSSSNSENESETSFCSTLSEFQDGKELLLDSDAISGDLSDVDENDTMYQLSDADFDEDDNNNDEILSIDESTKGSASGDIDASCGDRLISSTDEEESESPVQTDFFGISDENVILEENADETDNIDVEESQEEDKSFAIQEKSENIENIESFSIHEKEIESQEEIVENEIEGLDHLNDDTEEIVNVTNNLTSVQKEDEDNNNENEEKQEPIKITNNDAENTVQGNVFRRISFSFDEIESKDDLKLHSECETKLQAPELITENSGIFEYASCENDCSCFGAGKKPLSQSSVFCHEPINKNSNALDYSEVSIFEASSEMISEFNSEHNNNQIMNILFIWAMILVLILFFKLKCQ